MSLKLLCVCRAGGCRHGRLGVPAVLSAARWPAPTQATAHSSCRAPRPCKVSAPSYNSCIHYGSLTCLKLLARSMSQLLAMYRSARSEVDHLPLQGGQGGGDGCCAGRLRQEEEEEASYGGGGRRGNAGDRTAREATPKAGLRGQGIAISHLADSLWRCLAAPRIPFAIHCDSETSTRRIDRDGELCSSRELGRKRACSPRQGACPRGGASALSTPSIRCISLTLMHPSISFP